MKVPKIVYSILTDEEKTSLSLQRVHNKSTWQAGEILNRSHYKYLEIRTRAERFFKIFVLHFQQYTDFIPDGVNLNSDFKNYIELAILKRLKVKDIVQQIDNPAYKKVIVRDEQISRSIRELQSSKSLHAQNLYNLIMEFDRYNNFRILPLDVQEPSGFKRRNSARMKKHLKLSMDINPYTLLRLKEIYQQDSPALKNEGFVVLQDGIMRVKADEPNQHQLSRLSLYVFKTQELAENYQELIWKYLSASKDKDPKKGLRFWPTFRELTGKALNFDMIHNIAPTRKGLFLAMKEMDIYYHNKKTQKKN